MASTTGRGRGQSSGRSQRGGGRTSAGSSRIGIIGQGDVGSALERGLSKAGFEVRTSSSDPDEVRDVGEWGEVLVLAVPFGARSDAIETLGDAVEEKTLIDVTNALGDGMSFAGSAERSGAEELQEMAGDGTCVVKAFNTVFAAQMDKGGTRGEALTVFAAGDDGEARREAVELAEAIGFDVVDAGPLENARWLETLGYLNMQIAQQPGMGWDGGFRYVHKGAGRTPARSGRRPAAGKARKRSAGRRTATAAARGR
jgi:predicted dinucleotide-binding enzyme